MQDLKDQNDYIDLFFNERWTNYALDKSDEIPDLLLELEKETHRFDRSPHRSRQRCHGQH